MTHERRCPARTVPPEARRAAGAAALQGRGGRAPAAGGAPWPALGLLRRRRAGPHQPERAGSRERGEAMERGAAGAVPGPGREEAVPEVRGAADGRAGDTRRARDWVAATPPIVWPTAPCAKLPVAVPTRAVCGARGAARAGEARLPRPAPSLPPAPGWGAPAAGSALPCPAERRGAQRARPALPCTAAAAEGIGAGRRRRRRELRRGTAAALPGLPRSAALLACLLGDFGWRFAFLRETGCAELSLELRWCARAWSCTGTSDPVGFA